MRVRLTFHKTWFGAYDQEGTQQQPEKPLCKYTQRERPCSYALCMPQSILVQESSEASAQLFQPPVIFLTILSSEMGTHFKLRTFKRDAFRRHQDIIMFSSVLFL